MVINRDAERLSAEFKNPLIAGERAKSYAFVPMTIGDQVTGLIELQHMDREDAFSDADVRLLQTLAGSMSVALENARLFGRLSGCSKRSSSARRNWPSSAACSRPWRPSCTIKPSWTWWGTRSAASLTHRALESEGMTMRPARWTLATSSRRAGGRMRSRPPSPACRST